ncbi:MAG: FAD-dependent oxidoreductase [Limnochordia bacterium]|nr:FAD-dependent oxidoreductase [Limnochordia bacterium]MDD2629203.1 FAD-dependent oxidoreductase [Limnochordia bacterium]MDD4517631.1 FAD-dependent oxidoreductase [Limnochordia bacterium]
MKVLIVGGVAGGVSAAARLRRLDESMEIVIFERDEYISYANCGLPYYIGGVIEERDRLFVQSVIGMSQRFNLDIRTKNEVTKIDRGNKAVTVCELDSGREYVEEYDYLILSPGAEPVAPPIPGIEHHRVFSVRNISDTDRIKAFVSDNQPKNAVIVGGGFVGLEMAENLQHLGCQVTIVEMAPQVLGAIDQDMAGIVHGYLKKQGIKLYLNNTVTTMNHDADTSMVTLASGKKLPADLVVLGIGVTPNTNLAQTAGLAINEWGAIVTDEFLRTSDPWIYAVGDAIAVTDFVTGHPAYMPLAGPANKMGRIAANNICGKTETYNGSQGTMIIKLFELTAAATGSTERNLRELGIPYEKSYTHSESHASYYPGARPMSIKLLFDPQSGNILGGQIVGFTGVDKRIDVLATAIRFGGTVFDLQGLELAYAPPFSSAKDPVNMAGYVAGNIINNDMPVIHWQDLTLNEANMLIDVRTAWEFQAGHVEGAVNIPVDELRERIFEIPKSKQIMVYCAVGRRSYLATRILKQKGYDVLNISGGWRSYQAINNQLPTG